MGTKLNTTVRLPSALSVVREKCGAHFGSETNNTDPAEPQVSSSSTVYSIPMPLS